MSSFIRRILRRSTSQPSKPSTVQAAIQPWSSPDPELNNHLHACFEPSLVEAIERNAISSITTQIGPDLWQLPVFSEEGCRRLTDLIDDRLRWQRTCPTEPPNSMHYAGVVFGPMALSNTMSLLRTAIVEPLRPSMFPEVSALDEDYAFAATYGAGLDHRLAFHVDDSEITLNVSLGDSFEGGEIVFQGRRCPQHRQEPHRAEEEVPIQLPAGHGLIHAGNHRHLVTTVHGSRRNLIIWCKSSGTRASGILDTCGSWCGHQSD